LISCLKNLSRTVALGAFCNSLEKAKMNPKIKMENSSEESCSVAWLDKNMEEKNSQIKSEFEALPAGKGVRGTFLFKRKQEIWGSSLNLRLTGLFR